MQDGPKIYTHLIKQSKLMGFTRSADMGVSSLLKTLVASKPSGHMLELGTGAGHSLSWMLDGLNHGASITSIEDDVQLYNIAKDFLDHDPRVQLKCEDVEKWIRDYRGGQFDLIFADTWHGKYTLLDKTLSLVNVGGYYVIDNMLEQSSWPSGHAEKANALIEELHQKKEFTLTKINWSTGIIVMTKK